MAIRFHAVTLPPFHCELRLLLLELVTCRDTSIHVPQRNSVKKLKKIKHNKYFSRISDRLYSNSKVFVPRSFFFSFSPQLGIIKIIFQREDRWKRIYQAHVKSVRLIVAVAVISG